MANISTSPLDSAAPCPFCTAARVRVLIEGAEYRIACPDCLALGPVAGTFAAALATWDHRPLAEALLDAARYFRRNFPMGPTADPETARHEATMRDAERVR